MYRGLVKNISTTFSHTEDGGVKSKFGITSGASALTSGYGIALAKVPVPLCHCVVIVTVTAEAPLLSRSTLYSTPHAQDRSRTLPSCT
jgi:hypothetical protein